MSSRCSGERSDGDEDEAEGLKDTAWIRRAHNAEALPGRGVKCWVAPAEPLAAVGLQPSEVRVLVGNRALMADEGVPVSRRVPSFAPHHAFPLLLNTNLSYQNKTCCCVT